MTNYRRNFISGRSLFFTVNLAERRLRMLTEHIDLLREVFRRVRRHHPFEIDAIVVLPAQRHKVKGPRSFGALCVALTNYLPKCLPVAHCTLVC